MRVKWDVVKASACVLILALLASYVATTAQDSRTQGYAGVVTMGLVVVAIAVFMVGSKR